MNLPKWLSGKESAFQFREMQKTAGSLPRLRRSPGGGNGNPPQCSCLESPVDGGAGGEEAFTTEHAGTRPGRHPAAEMEHFFMLPLSVSVFLFPGWSHHLFLFSRLWWLILCVSKITGCPDIGSMLFLGMAVKVFPDEISIELVDSVKQRALLSLGASHPIPWVTEQNRRAEEEEFGSFWLLA